jgi:hypothetical protein
MTFLLKPNHVLGFVLLPLWMRAFTSDRERDGLWVASVLLALLAWVFLLHWSYAMLGLFVYPFVAPRLGQSPRWVRSWLGGFLSCLAAVPYVLFLYRNFPAEDTTVGRLVWESTNAFREGYFNVFAVSYEHGVLFFLSLVGIGFMVRRRSTQDVAFSSLLLGCVLGWGIFVAAFWMRRTIEPEEFYFYARFLLTVAAGSGLYVLARESHRLGGWVGRKAVPFPAGLCLVLLVTLPMTFPYWWDPGKMDRYYPRSMGPIPDPIEKLTAWARNETSPDDVFLAAPGLANWITALSGRRVLLTGDHRPPNDYERREELTRRVLTSRRPGPYREALESYLVTHLALDEEYVSSYGAELSTIRSLAWLELAYQDEGMFVFEIDRATLLQSSSRDPSQ